MHENTHMPHTCTHATPHSLHWHWVTHSHTETCAHMHTHAQTHSLGLSSPQIACWQLFVLTLTSKHRGVSVNQIGLRLRAKMLGGPHVQNGFQPHHTLKGLVYQSVEPVVASAARLLRNGTSHISNDCGWSLEAYVGLDFLRLGLERKHYFEEGDHNHTSLFLVLFKRLLRRDWGLAANVKSKMADAPGWEPEGGLRDSEFPRWPCYRSADRLQRQWPSRASVTDSHQAGSPIGRCNQFKSCAKKFCQGWNKQETENYF